MPRTLIATKAKAIPVASGGVRFRACSSEMPLKRISNTTLVC